MEYDQAIKDKHLTANDDVVLIEPLVLSTEGEICFNELTKEKDLIMTDNWKDKKQMKVCSPSQSLSSTLLPKSRLSTKLKKGTISQNLVITTVGSNGQKSMGVGTISVTSSNMPSKPSSQGNQLLPTFTHARIAAVVSNKKLKGENETTEINNGRIWKYANNFKAEPRRPLHPDLTESPALSEPEEASSGSSADSLKEGDEMEKYAVCPKCGNLSADFQKCDSCQALFSSNIKTYTRLPFKEADILKRKVPLASSIPQQMSDSVIKKQSFYSNNKFQEQYQVYANGSFNASPSSCKLVVTAVNPICQKSRMSKTRPQEPECLTISSDEEEHGMSQKGASTTDISSNLGIIKIEQRECCLPDSTTGAENENSLTGGKSLSSFEEDSMDSQSSEKEVERPSQKSPVFLKCRSIRIGSFKVQPTAGFSIAVAISSQDMCFQIPTVANCSEIVTVLLKRDDILRVLGHFGYSLPVLYVYTTPSCGCVIRNQLQMIGQNGPFYDPCGADETQKRITILPETISNCQRTFLRQVFPANLLQEIDQKNANEILVRSTPHTNLMKTPMTSMITRSILAQSVVSKQPVTKLLTYPPPPQTGGITITTEDLVCLKSGEFLNDVIIDFYLKYLVMEKLSPVDRQRTHVFSSFFYPRLTQKTNSRTNLDDDSALTPQAKRHSQVKTWTRHVDIFEKDFIIIPINQNSHWFLAIICFPGLVLKNKTITTNVTDTSPGEMEPSPSPSPSLSPAPSPLQRIGQVSSPVTPRLANHCCGPTDEECQSFSKAESENESVEETELSIPQITKDISIQESVEDPFPENSDLCESSIEGIAKEGELEKEPCIMIFDSLAGPSRWRIVGTLREYLAVEWQTKKGTKHAFDRETMRGYTPRVPQQNNYSDCGVYVLQYVESFFKTPLQKFSSPLPSLEDWFTEEIAMQKREELRSLILELQKRQAASSGGNISTEYIDSIPTSTVCFQGEENEQS